MLRKSGRKPRDWAAMSDFDMLRWAADKALAERNQHAEGFGAGYALATYRGDRIRIAAIRCATLLLWLNGEITEGSAAKALAVDRLTLRQIRDDYLADAMNVLGGLTPAFRPNEILSGCSPEERDRG